MHQPMVGGSHVLPLATGPVPQNADHAAHADGRTLPRRQRHVRTPRILPLLTRRRRRCETRDVRNDVEGLLTRDEVEALLATGMPWRVQWCDGGGLPPESGAGLPAPVDAVHGVPTQAQLRKYESGCSQKTPVFARIVEVNGEPVLDLREAGA